MRVKGFLAASFLSTVGDMLLVFSLPTGIGKETGEMSSAVVFWLIPAVAVFVASFLGKFIKKRSGNARFDYSKLLIVIAMIEIGIAILTFHYKEPSIVLGLSCLFVFLYAFTKEGVTRLFYNVAVYRFFCTPQEFSSLAGKKGGLDVLGGVVGIALASYLVDTNSWRYALIADAFTFVIIAMVIAAFGQDPKLEAELATDASEGDKPLLQGISITPEDIKLIKYVLTGIACLHAVNALYANYQPLINEKLNLISAGTSIILIAFLRTPGAACGLFVSQVTKIVPQQMIIKYFPILHLMLSLSFILFPHILTMGLVIVSGGVGVGIYIPTSINLLNKFSIAAIVDINVLISRWLGIFQAFACLVAMILFSSGDVPLLKLGMWMVLLSLLSLIIVPFHKKYFDSLERGHE